MTDEIRTFIAVPGDEILACRSQVTFRGVGRYKLGEVYRCQTVETAIGETGDLELSTLGNR